MEIGMKKFLNPWTWFEFMMSAVIGISRGLWEGLLSLVGVYPQVPRNAHENIQAVDVADAYTEEAEKQSGNDAAGSGLQESPDVVLAYARAGNEERALMDLGKLSTSELDWLLGLTDRDLILLAASGSAACARSLTAGMVIPSLPRPRRERLPEAPPAVLKVPNADYVRERFMMSLCGSYGLALKPH
ncbi:hypothetical protein LP421_05205 [Rhizobium sp. RCAM05350]|nr:hypothetical protein LP421_05205 [Rhizobium sp. RCAM05350]